jgi:hypothetical protein
MAGIEILTVATLGEFHDDVEAPALRWEPCGDAGRDDGSGLCEACGWLLDEHSDAPEPGGAVVVIPVPERPRLRRAS